MYAHPQQSLSNQKARYPTQPPQSYPNYPQPGMSNSQYNTQNPYHHSPTHSQIQHYQMNSQQMNYNPNAVWNGPPNANYAHQQQQYMNSNAALIQPPALNVQQNIDTNSQFFPPRQPMTLSNNQHSEFDNMQQQQEEQMWTNQAQIASMFWQQRCMTMLQRFQWFYQRFQILRGEYINLSEEMQKMDSEEEWHNFQQHHDQFHEKIVEMQQELSAVLGENQQLLQQKQVQEGESVWEQRYQQLLGNFKSLQEEMSHTQAGGGQVNGIPPEQYQHLEDQFGQLQYQYGEVVNELQNYRGAEMHINQYLQQIENYKHKLDSLQNENVQMQQMILQLQQKSKHLEQGYQNVVERQKYEELAYMIEQKDREIEQLQDYKSKSGNDSSISQYETALANKNAEIDMLRHKLAEKDKEISLGIAKLQSTEATLTNNLRQEFANEKYEMQKKISQLQKDLKEMKKETVRSTNQNTKVQSLQKKIEGLNNQVANLNETLKKKNQELNELRPMSYEFERLKENESNYNKVLEEKNKLSQILKKKNAEIEAMHHQVQKLSAKVHEVSNKKQEYSTRNLMIEIEDLTDQLRRYEGEIAKLKNIIELKEQYSQKLEAQIRLINEKYISTEQILLSQRENWRETEVKLSSKNLEHQKRIKNLDYEFNLQLKDNLEKEVISLRKQNVEKQETIRAMQEKQLLLASQIAVFEKLKNNFDRDISLLRKKEKQLQSLNEAQARRFKQLQAAYLGKENDADELKINQISMSSQLSALQAQIDDSNSLIKTKNKTIQNLQTELKQQLGRTQMVDELINQNGKLKIALKSSQQQLERLKFNSESRLDHSKVLSRALSRKDLQKEERNLINQLQEQNSYLRTEMSKMMQKQINFKPVPQQSQPISPQSKLVSLDLNKRLNQFNFKLHHTINDPKSTLSQSKSQKVIELWQNERKQLVDKYEAEIARLRQQASERQSNRTNVAQKTQHTHTSDSPRKQAYSHLQSQQLREQILFFRQKYKEQEERNQTLVKINEDLKAKLDNALKIKQGVSTSDYYKQQIKLLQNENQLLKIKCKKMLEENKEIKIELSNKNSKLSKDYELKILQLELNIQELKRKVSYLNAEKASANNQRASIQYNYNTSNYDRETYQPKTYKVQKYYEYVPESPKNIEQQFQSVLGNLQGIPSPKNNQQSYGPISQISSHTYNDSRINPTRSRNQK